MGRPPDLEKRARQQEAFLAAFARLGLVKTALDEVGLHMPAHYRWLGADPENAPVALARKKALADLAVHGKPLQATIF
jgi:hypothetical protein